MQKKRGFEVCGPPWKGVGKWPGLTSTLGDRLESSYRIPLKVGRGEGRGSDREKLGAIRQEAQRCFSFLNFRRSDPMKSGLPWVKREGFACCNQLPGCEDE